MRDVQDRRKRALGRSFFAGWVCVVGLFCLTPCVYLHGQNQPKNPIASVQLMRARQAHRIVALEQARDNARAALHRARRSLADAQQAGNHPAIKIAREAVSVAQTALNTANRILSEERKARVVLAGYTPLRTPPHPDDAAVEVLQGSLESYQDGGWITAKTPPGAVLRPGARIRTGTTGYAFLQFGDGHGVLLAPHSTFRILMSKARKEAVELEQGAMHVLRRIRKAAIRPFEVYSPTACVCVRGTEFDLRVDPAGVTHFAPYSGEITLAERAGMDVHPQFDRWWTGKVPGASDAAPLPAGVLARVVDGDSGARMERQTSAPGPVVAGGVLRRGDSIETGSGPVSLELQGGYRAVIGAGSKFGASTQGASAKPLYALLKGRMYVVSGPVDASAGNLKFLVPNAIVAPDSAEFEVTVGAGGLSDFVPLGGSLDIRASDKPLHFARISPWWERTR